MADSFRTLAELVTLNDRRNADRDISDVLNLAPALARMAADTCPETTHYYTKYTTAPSVGFRAAYDGRENSKSVDAQVSVALKILDASFAIDKAIADAYKHGKDAKLALEGGRHLQQAFFVAEKQMWYGTVHGDSGGFNGYANESDLNSAADAMVVNATGTTASTGSSVFLVRTTGDLNSGVIVAGKGGNIEIGETATIRLAGSSTGSLPAYYTPVSGWLGLQRGGTYDVARIANLTADSGKGLTDALIATALSKFKAGAGPTFMAMSKRSLEQLRKSRTATNATGAPAPIPTEAFGVPIVVTDSIIDTETLLA